MTSIGPPRRWARPTPSVTWIVWPFGWVCHAVRAPGVKWTLDAVSREASDGVATGSMYTAPVNQSLGPAVVSRPFLVILMLVLLVVAIAREPQRPRLDADGRVWRTR